MGRFTAFLAISAAAAVPVLSQDLPASAIINDAKRIFDLNKANAEKYHWTAGVNEFFNGRTFEDARALLGTELSDISEHMDKVLNETMYGAIKDSDIPEDFDSRTRWPGLIHPIRDQQQCGSCWAFSASEVLGDRVAIAKGKVSPALSPEDMVSCDSTDMGCRGGRLSAAWSYLENTGIVSDSCFPYTAGGGSAPECKQKCADSESFSASKVKAKTAYAIDGVVNMQKEIMTNGPIQVAFKVFKSFMNYKSGIYQKHFYELLPEGGHAVKIVGWGTENGMPYWTVANSWNTNWGEDGYFRIKRGSNACGMEKMGPPYAGMPAVGASDLFVV